MMEDNVGSQGAPTTYELSEISSGYGLYGEYGYGDY